jgi:hypothetical protein
MPRKPDIDEGTRLELHLPLSVRTRLDLILFSDLEGKVPRGRYQEFFVTRINEFFESKRLDLAPYGFPAGYEVFGPKEVIEALEAQLKGVTSVS